MQICYTVVVHENNIRTTIDYRHKRTRYVWCIYIKRLGIFVVWLPIQQRALPRRFIYNLWNNFIIYIITL